MIKYCTSFIPYKDVGCKYLKFGYAFVLMKLFYMIFVVKTTDLSDFDEDSHFAFSPKLIVN